MLTEDELCNLLKSANSAITWPPANIVAHQLLATMQREKKLRKALNGALGCMCHFQHIANPNRELIQKQIDETAQALSETQESV